MLRADAAEPFDLTSGPLLRVRAVRLRDEAWSVLVSHHHVALDGWSFALVVRDVFAAYEARRAGAVPGFPAAVPLRRYASWLGEQDAGAARAFWTQELADLTTPPALGGSAPSADFVRIDAELNAAATAALEACARDARVTLNALAVTAWGAALGAATGRPEVVIGTVVAGRPAEPTVQTSSSACS